jgi:L-ascorbate metabolism protein UlaG (beta-lactamase superfamily)/putative hemolysin
MKNIFTFVIILMALTACAAPQPQAAPEPAATDMPQAGMQNPASLYCDQNGNKLEIHTASDGSQSGVCIFPDGSTCDEWAYYRGECGPAKPATEASSGDPGASGGTGENGSDGYMTAGETEEISDLNDINSHGVRVTNIGNSNSGFMITTSHKKILIDALFRGIKGVYTLPEDTQNLLGLAQSPFDNVDLILVTHSHRDHFDSSLVRQHLQNDPNAVIASQSRIISQYSTFADQIVNLDPTPGKPVQTEINGIHVEALALSHGPGQSSNIGFVITVDGIKLFFSGDIDTSQFSYEEFRAYKLPEEKIDIAFIQHFYLTDIPSDQQFVKQGIGAKYIIPMHFYFTDPPMDPKTVLRNYPDAIFFNGELSNWVMP